MAKIVYFYNCHLNFGWMSEVCFFDCAVVVLCVRACVCVCVCVFVCVCVSARVRVCAPARVCMCVFCPCQISLWMCVYV